MSITFKVKLTMKTYLNKNNPKYLIQKVTESSLEKKDGKIAMLPQEVSVMAQKYVYSKSLKNMTLLSEAVDEEYKAYVIQIVNDLKREFKINRPSEKILLHNLAISHIKITQLTSKLNKYLDSSGYFIGNEKYCSILSKELDKSYKHYDSMMKLLLGLKAKPINVKINTFQQLNVGDSNKLKT